MELVFTSHPGPNPLAFIPKLQSSSVDLVSEDKMHGESVLVCEPTVLKVRLIARARNTTGSIMHFTCQLLMHR